MSQDPHDHLLLQIRGAVAEYERTLIADRMRRGRQMKLRAGVLLPWATPPYGYRVHPDQPRDPSGVQIDPTEGAIVQELFRRYGQDHETLLGLAKYLSKLDIKSPRGNPRWSGGLASWHPLQSLLYGQCVYGTKTHASGSHPTLGNSPPWQTRVEPSPGAP